MNWLRSTLSRFGSAAPAFEGERAFADLTYQVALGPRVPGSPAHDALRAWLRRLLTSLADEVATFPFTYTDGHDPSVTYGGLNLVASFNLNPKVDKRVMLAAHYDTRPVADRDPDPARRADPVPGANDGASGVAVLLEMARLLHEAPPRIRVDLAFFDLEDLGDDPALAATPEAIKNPFSIGAEHFAAHHLASYRPTYGVVVDMVGAADLRIPQEAISVQAARPVVDKVWRLARELGAEAFVDEAGGSVMDDHVPFLQRGVPFVTLVHWPFFEAWHTTADTPERCRPASLQQVGDVLTALVYGY